MRTALLAFAMFSCLITAAQKGRNTFSFGPFYSSPVEETKYRNILSSGIGIEATYEPRLSNHHAILIQGALASHKGKEQWLYHDEDKINIASFKLGYRYYLKPAGFYFTGGALVDYYTDFEPISFGLIAGTGKRFILNERFFIDAGLDYIDGSTEKRVNLKLAIGKFRKLRTTISNEPIK